MGTRARIALQTGKTFLSIYTHWDGYPSHHGPILLNHYNTPAKVRELIKLGDLSSLGKEIGEEHDPDSDSKPLEAKDWCKAYLRDCGEKNVSAKHSATLKALESLADRYNADHTYLFTPEGWRMNDSGAAGVWKDLALEVIKTKLTA